MSEPLIQNHHTHFVDPLLQAIVLTAIVIGFGMTAFLLVLIYRTYRVTKEDEISALREVKKMMSNLLILPMLLPFLCALILVFTKNKNQTSKILSIMTMVVTTLISLALLIYVVNHKPITLDFGGWKAPFGIQFLGDSLSLLMVTVSSFVVTLIMAYGFGRGEKRVNRFHLPTFILLLTVGVIGSFLTSDLFNLYVMFEIMLLASFVLVTLGQSVEQLRAAIIYVVLNIIGSWLFLLGIGMLYKSSWYVEFLSYRKCV